MKRLLFIFVALSVGINMWAKRKIHLNKDKQREKDTDCRMPVGEPTADCENRSLFLSFNGPLDKLQIVVKDGAGQIVYSDFLFSIFPNQCYAFSIGNVEDGVYILELNDGDTEYSGYFEIY